MEALLFFVIAGSGAALWTYASRKALLRQWRRLMQSSEYSDIELSAVSSWLRPDCVTGVRNGFRLSLQLYRGSRSEDGTLVTMGPLEWCRYNNAEVTLEPEGFRTDLQKAFGAREIEIGDGTFDSRFLVRGDPALAAALLDAQTRVQLESFQEPVRWTIGGGTIAAEIPRAYRADTERLLPRLFQFMMDVCHRAASPPDVVGAIRVNARQDPHPRVRLFNLRLVVNEHRSAPETTRLLREAVRDAAVDVRLYAALALGVEGHATLIEVAETANDRSAAEAVAALGPNLPVDRALQLLETAVRARCVDTANACIELLGRSGGAMVIEPLSRLLREPNHAETAATALGVIGSTVAETPLLWAVNRDAVALRRAAAEALGRAGTAAAVLPLKEVAENDPDRAVRRAAREAVGAIQSRLPGASPGQLSLPVGEAGQISLAPSDAGAVSLPEGGAVSLPPDETDRDRL